MKHILLLIALTFTVLSCTTQIPLSREIRKESKPKLNEIQTEQIGNSLVGQYTVEQAELLN